MKNFVLYVIATTIGLTFGCFVVGGFNHYNGDNHKHSNIIECHCKKAEQPKCYEAKNNCCEPKACDKSRAKPACECNGLVECDCWGKNFCDCQAKWPAIWIAGNKFNNELSKLNDRLEAIERKFCPQK